MFTCVPTRTIVFHQTKLDQPRTNMKGKPDQTRPVQTKPDQPRTNMKGKPDQTRPNHARPDQTKPDQQRTNMKGRLDQTRPDQNRPDQTNQTSQENVSITSYFQKRRLRGVRQLMFCLLYQCFIV